MSSTTTSLATGLSSAQAAARLRRDGPNRLPTPPPPSHLILLLRQFTHFFALLLWVASALALVGGMPQLAVAIAVVVVLNGVFAFIQEYRADKAGQRLRELLPTRVTVRRDGRRLVVDASTLVVGDVVLLESGDRVSADLELVEVHDLALDESLLTGESVPVRPPRGGHAYAGTFVTQGEASTLVVATGGNTRLAGIAALTRRAHPPPTPLARRLRRVVSTVAIIAITVGMAFFGAAVALGMPPAQGFLLGVGVTVALVPEGLLPTVTLSLARAAQLMARRKALVRHLESVETLGATTFICTDKTGTLTRNEMTVVEVWTPQGSARVRQSGYTPTATIEGDPRVLTRLGELALAATRASTGRLVEVRGRWRPVGDPMEVALHALALRSGVDVEHAEAGLPVRRRYPFDARRRRASVAVDGELYVKGAPDAVLPRCGPAPGAHEAVTAMSARGLRVLAIARRELADPVDDAEAVERDLTLLGLVGLEDPPRDDVAESIAACRSAGIRLAMVTGDHPGTARAIAVEVGLARPGAPVLRGDELPEDDAALGELIDCDGIVIARVTPEDKLRIARALQRRGHVVAMTGDGVNDGPALREADIGVAMGASGTDVAREAADLVLLDDHFATIVAAVELGRATFANIRRFLTYHLTDNVAELVPFLAWALTGGRLPLAIGVLQVLALDIGTDLLPALALGAEPPNPRTMQGPARTGGLVDRRLLGRVFGVLGLSEAAMEMVAFVAVLTAGGWRWGATPGPALAGTASGTAFATVVLGQLAAAFACRSESRWVGRLRWPGNPLLLGAVVSEAAMLLVFLGFTPLARLLGGSFPDPLGWLLAGCVIPLLLAADTLHKALRARAPRR